MSERTKEMVRPELTDTATSEGLAANLRTAVERYEAAESSSNTELMVQLRTVIGWIREDLHTVMCDRDHAGDDAAALEDPRFDSIIAQAATILEPRKRVVSRSLPGVDSRSFAAKGRSTSVLGNEI